MKIFSNVDFHVTVENDYEDDKKDTLIRHKVNRSDTQPNEYYLTMTVPREINRSFKSRVILTHPVTG